MTAQEIFSFEDLKHGSKHQSVAFMVNGSAI